MLLACIEGNCATILCNRSTLKFSKHMNSIQLNFRLSLCLSVALLALFGSPRSSRAAEAAISGPGGYDRMQAARNEVATVRSNVFLTLLALDRVRTDPDPTHVPFQAFTNQLVRMEELAKALAKRSEQMKERGAAYFADWESRKKEIQDAGQRAQAEQRYAERRRNYDAINKYFQDARPHFLTFVTELSAACKLIEGEHTDKAKKQVGECFSRANWGCLDAQRDLLEIEARFDRLADSFAAEL